MSESMRFVADEAMRLIRSGQTAWGGLLSDLLNNSGHRTSYGSLYSGGRGIFTLIRTTWKRLMAMGLADQAEAVARAFVKANGRYAYE